MGRVIGLIACSSLVAAALWLTNLATTTRTLSAGNAPRTEQQAIAARDAFKRGKELYLRGRYEEAIPLLLSSSVNNSELNLAERQVAAEYLSRACQRTSGSPVASRSTSADQSSIRSQSPEGSSLPAGVDEAAKTRVERLMSQAKVAAQQGRTKDATTLATQAFQISREARLKFSKGEVSPGEFLAMLQDGTSAKADQMAWAEPSTPAPKSEIQLTSGQTPDWASLTAEEEASSPAVKGLTGSSAKAQAEALVTSARNDIRAGDYDAARKKALSAMELKVSYGLFDDRPELVIADLDRKQGTTTVTGAATKPTVTMASEQRPEEAASQRATALILEAREAMQAGQYSVAKAKATEAQKLGASYKLFDDRPELILSEIETRSQSAAKIAQASAAQDAPKSNADNTAKAQVTQLLVEARSALKGGLIEEARRKAMEAEKLASASKVTYQLFEDRPEIVIADAARMATRGNNAASGAAVADHDPAVIKARTEASDLLKQARNALAAGQVEKARALATKAEAMNVAYEVFADTPDAVLADIEAESATMMASRTKVQPAGATVPAGETKSAAVDLARADQTPAASPWEDDSQAPAPIAAAQGLSAIDLYNRGMFELNRGNREAAYQAFSQAYESGQKLDRFRAQRLRDYMRELAPKGGRDVQMVNHQTESGPALTEGGVIDDAAKAKSLQFDRLRTETLSTIFKAEQLREKDPETALQMIDRQLATIESSELSPESMAQLQSSLGKTRVSLTNEIEQRKPNLDQKRHNEEVLARIKGSTETKIRIEQEYAKLVEEFNELFKQKRFAEAEVVAKKAKELNPSEPTSETLIYKSRYARRNEINAQLKDRKDESHWKMFNDVEQAMLVNVGDENPVAYPENWKDLSARRSKFGTDNRKRTDAELKIQESLNRAVSLHEDNVPLGEVIKKISAMTDINIVIDPRGVEEEGATTDALVSIDVDGIPLKSVLNLILERFNLAYMIQDDVLKITSRLRQQGQMIAVTYPVADLVVPIPNFATGVGVGMNNVDPRNGSLNQAAGSMMSVPAGMGGMGGQSMAQVAPNVAGGLNQVGSNPRAPQQPTQSTDYDTLIELITRTIAPDSWEQVGGPASIQRFETTLSLVIRQTQAVHEEITDLLKQLRRLQDLQVTVEVRFVTVSDSFFERIGVDFDFNVNSTVGGPETDNLGLPLPPFGAVQLPTQGAATSTAQAGTAGTAGTTGATGTAGTAGQQAQQGAGLFGTQPRRNTIQRSSYQKGGTIVGLGSQNSFTPDLDIPFRQGSFDIGVPDFGGFDPTAGITTGLAILSDLEAFFFIQAAQGDSRSNLLFAPKLTLFNGQTATVSDTVNRFFVTGYNTTVGVGAAIQTPQIQQFPEGVSLTVTAVISADRRYVRLTIIPNFTSITDVQTFSTASGVTGNQAQAGGAGGQAFGGVQAGGNQQVGGGQQNFGFGGIGGFGGSAPIANQASRVTMGQVNQNGNNQNGNNQNGQVQQPAQVVQLPVVEQVTVLTTVSVPDGGTVLLGGVKRLREGRNMAGVPILNKIPYVSRLFKNSGVGRETESLMLMVTPRIVIQEEEEELLGVEID